MKIHARFDSLVTVAVLTAFALCLALASLHRRLLLGEGCGGGRQQGESQDKLAHVILHFGGRKSAPAERRFGSRHGFVGWQEPRNAATRQAQAGQMRLN